MTARYLPRFFEVNALASSVASTANPFSCPSFRIAAMPGPMEVWRKPSVLEKTSTRESWLCAAAAQSEIRTRARATSRCMAVRIDGGMPICTPAAGVNSGDHGLLNGHGSGPNGWQRDNPRSYVLPDLRTLRRLGCL